MNAADLPATPEVATPLPGAKKLRGVFLNAPEANCSIYESGKMAYQSLILSEKYQLDYQEIDVNSRAVSPGYHLHETISIILIRTFSGCATGMARNLCISGRSTRNCWSSAKDKEEVVSEIPLGGIPKVTALSADQNRARHHADADRDC